MISFVSQGEVKVKQMSLFRNLRGDHIVWWYGGVQKSHNAETVPDVIVYFREIDSSGCLGEFTGVKVGITMLGLLRIGSIWREGFCHLEAHRTTDVFDVNFSKGGWRFVSPCQYLEQQAAKPIIRQQDYPLRYTRDRNWLVDLKIGDGKSLLIPCLEFFTRYYGASAEVRRVLTAYPWDEALARLFSSTQELPSPGRWPVKLAKRMTNGDVIFLAHLLYDEPARLAARRIYSQLEAKFSAGNSIAFPQIGPWYTGPSRIKATGIWINDMNTFLALQINGICEPAGLPISRDRDNTNKIDQKAEAAAGRVVREAWSGMRTFGNLPKIVDCTDDDDPDQGSGTVEVEEASLEILGLRRVVVDVRREKAHSEAGTRRADGASVAFSSGENYGTGKGVGHASLFVPQQNLESKGTLRDMWNALIYLQNERPDVIENVKWYSPADGFSSSSEPKLIPLKPFDQTELVGLSKTKREWPYLDVVWKTVRGLLVVKIIAGRKVIYIIEIQRRPRVGVAGTSGEESFRGLVWILGDKENFQTCLKKLLSKIKETMGVVKNLEGQLPGIVLSFKHSHSKDDKVPCMAGVLNALRKVGVKV
ncbi:hypothetical protein GMST_14180 [Geomonas silvestris]|uniref:TnsE C-terminal domain-containing protein n=1 Tax=Geomonas silvestris TaxID=2740184 RepID=A0A6V8MH02_9BACT|nr:hypothetical protein [Geomonas silvestris]GFO59093.1 hypothetical protein GMST_14180 [Geomonas silvestris]